MYKEILLFPSEQVNKNCVLLHFVTTGTLVFSLQSKNSRLKYLLVLSDFKVTNHG